MEIGLVQRIDIDEEMQQAYLDYAMSVIVARALPDARDGLKPVHRRILYAMHDMGMRPDSPYKKSARIVGEVLGKYHPHGDMAVYEAMARMAQDFSMRYPLVDGQGNFGSVDGDAPAAMRYTEARLANTAAQMLADIQKNTVNFETNFDGTLTEPTVLPGAVPNLLVNGATGIAVGMATSIPPHNLGEVIDALHYMLEKWEKLDDINVEDLMVFVQGPDFPTGGIIIHEEENDGLISAYSTGRGKVTVQASAHLEEMERGRNRIIINELPYMTNKSSLIERIASLAREERIESIADLRDESDRQGMRIVIELTKTADPQKVLSELYKSTPMQTTFSMIMLALVDGEPRVLGLKHALRVFVEHRLDIIRRRSEFDLEKARQRSHVLEGLLVALKNLDEAISIIRKSPDAETARDRLIKRFKLTLIQAQAILDMPLRRLAALERKKIEEEFKEVQALIKDLEGLLKSPKRMRQVVDQELQTIKETFADRRRTHIARLKAGVSKVSMLTTSDLKPDLPVWVSVSEEGLIARSLEDQPPRVSAKDSPLFLTQANTRDTLYLVNDQGEAAAVPVHALPEAETPISGLPLHKVSSLREGTTLAGIFALPSKERRNAEIEGSYILTGTHQGMLKKTAISELPGPSASTFILARVNPGDRLGWIGLTSGKDDLLLVTTDGMGIRFNEDEIRPMGLVAAGVMGIKLQQKDELIGVVTVPKKGDLFLLASDGSAKRVPFDQFSRQGRYGQGLITWKLPANIRVAGIAAGVGTARLIVHSSKPAPKIIRLDDAPLMSRTARGQSIIDIKPGEQIKSTCMLPGATKTSTAESTSGGSPKAKTSPVARENQAPPKRQRTSVTASQPSLFETPDPPDKAISSTPSKNLRTSDKQTSMVGKTDDRKTLDGSAKTTQTVSKTSAKMVMPAAAPAPKQARKSATGRATTATPTKTMAKKASPTPAPAPKPASKSPAGSVTKTTTAIKTGQTTGPTAAAASKSAGKTSTGSATKATTTTKATVKQTSPTPAPEPKPTSKPSPVRATKTTAVKTTPKTSSSAVQSAPKPAGKTSPGSVEKAVKTNSASAGKPPQPQSKTVSKVVKQTSGDTQKPASKTTRTTTGKEPQPSSKTTAKTNKLETDQAPKAVKKTSKPKP